MFGSIDCTHVEWKNCPTGWHGMFQGKSTKPTIVMEAVTSQDLWIWHSFIGAPGSNNDINIVDKSPLVPRWLQGPAGRFSFQVDGQTLVLYYVTQVKYIRYL
jgi:hypothetical protein